MNLQEQLRRDEGLRLKAYTDSTGHLTIGYGHNLENGIPEVVADALLAFDITQASADVFAHLPWSMQLDEARRGVLCNMAFNLGIGGLLKFVKMLKHAEAHNWSAAAKEMRDSKWATQVGPRAERLAIQMETGTWQ
jgi:lysozyme